MLRKISLANVGLVVGLSLTIMGFIAYGTGNATLNLAGFFYGIPVLLGGLALKAAELKPIPFSETTPGNILILREKQATDTQNQLRKDVTRYRYGQDAHLDDSLQRIGLSPTDEERPVLVSIQETEIDDNYTLLFNFDSPLINLDIWEEKKAKIEKFFGPGIKVQLSQPAEEKIKLALIASPEN
jgi:hypothetical protein